MVQVTLTKISDNFGKGFIDRRLIRIALAEGSDNIGSNDSDDSGR